eukprot:167022_1
MICYVVIGKTGHEVASKMIRKFYRPNQEANAVNIDVTQFSHNYDPLSPTYDAIRSCTLITNLKMNASFIIRAVISFIGYIESTLHLESGSNFGCSKFDVEQLFIISPPNKSTFSYKLISFATDIRTSVNKHTTFCATLLLFDKDKLEKNDGDIIWQSAIFSSEYINYLLPEKREDGYINPEYDTNIVIFNDINVVLENNKTYAIKIDIPQGYTSCNLIHSGQKDRSRQYFVNSNGHWRRNKYNMKGDRDGKVYELTLGI